MAIKVGINGFGRIGRNFFKVSHGTKDFEIVAVNDLADPGMLAHLLKYDSVFGGWNAAVGHDEQNIIVDGKPVKVLSEKDPAKLPWKDLGVEIVVESTGLFTDAEKAKAHIAAGAKKVIISAPAKNEDITIVLGVNESKYDPAKHHILSNASCTTNCLGPVVKVIHEALGIESGLMTTIHSYTNDQAILDLPHRKGDKRRSRAAALSMVPTTTGAAKAIALVMPELKGKLNGYAMRVPTPNVSVVDLKCRVNRDTTKEEINGFVKAAAATPGMKGILFYSDTELVSHDFNGNLHSSIFDSTLTDVVDKRMVQLVSWYDNEMGYSARVRDLIVYISKK